MRKVLVILSTLAIFVFILVARSQMLQNLEKHVTISKNPYYSETIDLGRKHTFSWKISRADWHSTEKVAKIYLIFEKTPEMTGKDYRLKLFDLKVKIDTYAITENNVKAPRYIKNYFFPSDEPMEKDSQLWAGSSDQKKEYLLGYVVMGLPYEDLYVDLTIKTPDAFLAKANPRLKIVGDYDPAVLGHIGILYLIRDAGIIICLLALFFLTSQALKREGTKKEP